MTKEEKNTLQFSTSKMLAKGLKDPIMAIEYFFVDFNLQDARTELDELYRRNTIAMASGEIKEGNMYFFYGWLHVLLEAVYLIRNRVEENPDKIKFLQD